MEKKLLEVEGGEIAISSSNGMMAIVPKNKVNWVKKKLEDGCHECIDSLVETLPNFDEDGQKAADGVMLDTDPPKRRDPNQKFYESETEPDTFIAQYSLPEVGISAERPMSSFRKALSNLNPKNWFVDDYSQYSTRGEAYAAARQAGLPEFMYKGERFNTKMAGTAQQQMQWSGITDERIHNRGIEEKRLSENLDPFSYSDMAKRYWSAAVMNEKDPKRLERENASVEIQDKPFMGPRTDAFNLYTGLPQKYNSFSVSQYKPSRSSDGDQTYYSINRYKDPKVAQQLVDQYENDIKQINEGLAFRKITEEQLQALKNRHLKYSEVKQDKVLPVGITDDSDSMYLLGKFIDQYNKHSRTRDLGISQVESLKDYVRLMNEPELADRMGLGDLSDEDTKVLNELRDLGNVMTPYDPKTKSMQYIDASSGAGVMGHFNVSKGMDAGRPYISYRDLWDIEPRDFGKPFEIYDRIYLDELKKENK